MLEIKCIHLKVLTNITTAETETLNHILLWLWEGGGVLTHTWLWKDLQSEEWGKILQNNILKSISTLLPQTLHEFY